MPTDGNLPVSVNTAASANRWYDKAPYYPTYPLWQPGNTYVYTAVQPPQDYANEIDIDRGEHDATLRFYRRRGSSRMLVKEVSVPLVLLDKMAET